MEIQLPISKSESDNRSTIILSIAVLLTGLTATDGMPLEKRSDEFWLNSCGRQMRHSRSSGIYNDHPRKQMNILISQINNITKKELLGLYHNHPSNWRVKSNCFNVKAFMKLLRKSKNMKETTLVLYQMLIKLGKFIDKLRDVPITTGVKFDEPTRVGIYDKARHNLRSVVCEFNTTLTNSGFNSTVAELVDKKIPPLNNKCIPESFDSSMAQVRDVSFFRKLLKFLKLSSEELNKKRKKGKRHGAKRKGGKKNKNKTNKGKGTNHQNNAS